MNIINEEEYSCMYSELDTSEVSEVEESEETVEESEVEETIEKSEVAEVEESEETVEKSEVAEETMRKRINEFINFYKEDLQSDINALKYYLYSRNGNNLVTSVFNELSEALVHYNFECKHKEQVRIDIVLFDNNTNEKYDSEKILSFAKH